MQPDEIEARLSAAFPGAGVEIGGEGCSVIVDIISDRFDGLGRLARQRLVLGLFADEIAAGELHAMTVRARGLAD